MSKQKPAGKSLEEYQLMFSATEKLSEIFYKDQTIEDQYPHDKIIELLSSVPVELLEDLVIAVSATVASRKKTEGKSCESYQKLCIETFTAIMQYV